MRILFVASGAKNGKSTVIVSNQAASLRKIGIDIEMFLLGFGLSGYLNSVISLRKQLRNNNYDLIHAHYGLSGLVSLLSNKRLPLVISFMGDDILGSVKNGKYTVSSKMLSKINLFCTKYFYNYVIAKSLNILQKLPQKTNIEIIPNGVDLDLFYPIDKNVARGKLNLIADKKYIVFASNPDREEKNYKLASAAVELLMDSSVNLITITGKDQKYLNLLFNACDCLLLTSLHEGSPNVIKEAMAVNLPVVSTDVGDVRQNLSGVSTSFVCDFDPYSIMTKLRFVLDQGSRTNGRDQIILQGLDSETIANRFKHVYQKMLRVD